MERLYDPFSEETLKDPGTAWDVLLQEDPVNYYEDYDPPFYTLARHDDVATALRDIETYSSEFGQGPRFTPPNGMLDDPPKHTFFRGLVQKAFTPGAVRAMAPRIEELANELLDDVEGRDRFDLHDDYAFPLPVVIISEMLGVPREDIQKFKYWSDASVEAMGAKDPTPWVKDLEELEAYLQEQIEDRRARKGEGDDLICRLVRVEEDGEGLRNEDVNSIVRQLLVGGNETTTSLITNCVWRLLQHPELYGRVVDDPSLIDKAIEESLRYDPPVLGLYRNTTRDVELRGKTIPRGSKVMMCYAAANRDPEVYDDPNTFSLDRPNRRHLAFGLGVHFCLGAELARLEARSALKALTERFPNLSLVDDGDRIKPFFLWGRRTLPVKL